MDEQLLRHLLIIVIFMSSYVWIVRLERSVQLLQQHGTEKKQLKWILFKKQQVKQTMNTIKITIFITGSFYAIRVFSFYMQKASEVISINFTILLMLSILASSIVFSSILIVEERRFPIRNAEKEVERHHSSLRLWSMIGTMVFLPLNTFIDRLEKRTKHSYMNQTSANIAEEIKRIVERGEQEGFIQKGKKRMLHNVLQFNHRSVGEVMTHRRDIVGVASDATIEEITDIVLHEKYTRLPVYKGSMDHIIGVVNVKDLLPYITHKRKDSFQLINLIRKPLFVPKGKKNERLFKELQKNCTHIAIVIDEYGGTAGLITMEDLIEEIVGAIRDEYDDDEIASIEKIDDATFRIQGSTSLQEIEQYFNVSLKQNRYETLSGFIIGELGRFIEEGETPEIETELFLLQVEKVEERRIVSVKVTMKQQELVYPNLL